MAKLRRGTQSALSETSSLRLRAAWLYFHHQLTQKDVAEQLGIARSTVIRLLEEAQRRSEVRIWIEEGEAQCIQLALELERALGLDECIVVPEAPAPSGTAGAVGLALGKFLSESLADGMRIGVGWGRTLTASLASFRPPRHERMEVMSLLGGAINTDFANPVEFAWRMSSLLDARCYLFPAPAIVDSAATKVALVERCGLGALMEMADRLDLAIVSVGDVSATSTALGGQLVTAAERRGLVKAGAVCDVMCNFIDAQGRTVDHPVNERVMSVGLDAVKSARHVVIAAGGAHRTAAIVAAQRRIGCHTLVTDESAARAILSQRAID